MHKRLKLVFAATCFGLLANPSYAVTESEPNNDFASRTVLSEGILSVDSGLSSQIASLVPDFVYQNQTLQAGTVNAYDVPSLIAGTPFYAMIDNSASSVDTEMGVFDELANLLDYNDDGGPFGDNYASALFGSVNDNGSINLKVTGFNDTTFIGDHAMEGQYDLSIFLNVAPDIDFVTFTGLPPGAHMFAEITSADFDSILGWFDTDGLLIDSNDDLDNTTLLSKLAFNVATDGTATFAVSGFPDFGFVGDHNETGAYQLALTAVPVPAAVWLFGSALLCILSFAGYRNPNA